jgi:hypothetical protein
MFNLLGHKGNANQNALEFHLTPDRMAVIRENKLQGCERKGEYFYTVGETAY